MGVPPNPRNTPLAPSLGGGHTHISSPRQNYDTTESKLRREFEVYGPIKRVSAGVTPHLTPPPPPNNSCYRGDA